MPPAKKVQEKQVPEKQVPEKKEKKPKMPELMKEESDYEDEKPMLVVKANIKYCTAEESDRLVKIVMEGMKNFKEMNEFEVKVGVSVNPDF